MSNIVQTQEKSLKELTCFLLHTSLWGARKKLRPEDLKGTAAENLPPADLASLGSKRIIDPKAIAVFDTLKKKAERKLDGMGVRFLSGWAIPDSKAAEAAKILDEVTVEFAQAHSKFIQEYNTHIQNWITGHPQWEGIIRNAVMQDHEVANRIKFQWSAFKVVEASDQKNSALNNGLSNSVGGLAGQLYRETAAMAKDMLDRVTRISTWRDRTLSPLRQIRSKLVGLSFLDGGVQTLIDSIDHVLSKFTGPGPYITEEIHSVLMLLAVLKDEQRMIEHIRTVSSGAPLQAIFTAPALVAESSQAVTSLQPAVSSENISDEAMLLEVHPSVITANTPSSANLVEDSFF